MGNNFQADSLAITSSKGVYELAQPRTITTDDVSYTTSLALSLPEAAQIVVTGTIWEVDGSPVHSPVGEWGSRLSVVVDLLLVNGSANGEG